ncbi:MAG: PAS domain-containing protein [Deltaproteobacteria bacterium]|nr:PAS domain-containing protein [Deltaproteobacteria bacterium]
MTGDLQWSDECYHIYGFRPQEFIPTYKKFRSIVHPEDLGFVQEQVDAALNNDKHYDVDFRFVRPNGEIGWLHCEGEVMRDAEGKQLRFFGTQIDITERKQVEEELQGSYHKLRETLIATVNALASTIEMRDSYTAGHQRRVTMLACAIAEEMGLTDEQFDGLRLAGLVHDIGKITVPAEILSRPGRISDAEFNIIKTHAQAGYNVLKDIEFPWPVAQIVLQHHERLDGSGYPQGLKDGGIMLEARILAVADVVEAMASHRPYRPALGIEAALEEITKNRGVLYDPEVADICARLFIDKGFALGQEI